MIKICRNVYFVKAFTILVQVIADRMHKTADEKNIHTAGAQLLFARNHGTSCIVVLLIFPLSPRLHSLAGRGLFQNSLPFPP